MLYQQPYNDSLNYYYYKQALTREDISRILIDLEHIEYHDAKVLLDDSLSDARRSRVKWVPKGENWTWLYERIMNIALEANQNLWHFDIFSCEHIQYTEYHSSQSGHYGWHQDLGSDYASHRKISISIQISEPQTYTGGELQFWLGKDDGIISIDKSFGEATVFPSYIMHRVTPVTVGVRKSLVAWIGGSHFR